MGAMASQTPASDRAGNRPAYRVVGITEETRADFQEVDHLTWFDEVHPADPDWSRALDLRLVAAQEPRAIDVALAAAVGTSVDELEHEPVSHRLVTGQDDLWTRRYHSASSRTCFSV